MNRPLEPTTPAAPTLEALTTALAEKERALAEANARQEATAEILQIVSRSTDDAQPVFEAIVLAGVRLLHCDVAGLFECDGAVYSPVAGADPTGLITLYGPSKVPIDPAATFPSRAIVANEIVEIPDWSRIELPEVERQVHEASGLNSTIYLPLLRDGACIALLVFGSNLANNFGPREIAIAESFRDHALIAIENARLFNETKEALERQTATSEILRAIAGSPSDARPVFESIVVSAVKRLQCDLALVMLSDDKVITPVAAANPEGLIAASDHVPIDWNHNFPSRALLDKTTYYLPDWSVAELPPHERNIHKLLGLSSAIYMPLLRDGEARGLLTLGRNRPSSFSPSDIAQAEAFRDQANIALENARLFDEVQAKTRDLEEALVYQTGSANILKVIAASPTDVAPVLKAIVDSACEVCDAYDAVVLLRDGDDLRVSAHRGPIPPSFEKWPINRRWVAGRAFVDQRPVHVRDLSTEGEEFPDGQEFARRTGLRTILSVPLMREGESIGSIVVRRNEAHSFSEKQIVLLQTFADQAVIALGNVRLFDEVQARTHDLSEALQQQTATADVLKVISRSVFDVQAVLDTLVESAYKLCGARMGLLYLAGEDAFECKAIAGTGVAEAATVFKGRPIRAGRGTAAERVILTGEVQSIEDFFADPDFDPKVRAAIEAARAAGSGIGDLRSTLAAPMKRDDSVIGVIAIARAETGPFPQRQVELLQTFADQAVIAIENARLFHEVEAKTRDLSEALRQQTATSDVLKVISRSAFDLQAVLDTLLSSAVALSGAGSGVLAVREGDVFRAKSFVNKSPDLVRFLSQNPIAPNPGTVMGRVALSGRIEWIEDTLADSALSMRNVIQRTNDDRALVGVPLLRDARIEGAIVLGRNEPGRFSTRAIELAQIFADQAVIAIENVRLFNEVKSKTDDLSEALQQQTATADVLKVISRSAFDLQAVLDTLVESAVSLIEASSGVIWLRDGDVFTVKAASSAEEQQAFFAQLRTRPQKPGRGSIGARVLLTGEVQIVSDIKADPEYDPVIKAATNARTLLGVPLLRDGVIIGAFVLALHKLGTFTPRQIDLVKTFADQAVIAIENARLFDEVQARTRDLSEALEQQTATADVLKVISRSVFDLETVLQTLIDTAVRLGRGTRGTIFIRKGDVLVASAFHRNVPKKLRDYLATTPWRIGGDSDMARAVRERKVVHIPDLSKSQDAATSEVRKRAAFGAALWVPLMRDGEAIGLFGVPRDEPIAFTDREIEIVKTFADQAVIAIENARLFAEVQAKTHDLEESLQQQTATADVLKVISRSAFDLDAVLTTLVQSAQRLCDAEGSMIFVRDGDVYPLAACVGMPDAFIEFRRANPLRADRLSAVGRVALTGETTHLPDVLADPDIQKAGPRLGGFRAVLSVPLVRDSEVVGIFALSRPTPGAFAPGQVKLVQTFADQAAIAIANVRLFNEVKSKTEDLSEALQQQTATADVLKVISRSAFGLQTVLQTLVDTAVRFCAADGVIYLRHGDIFIAEASFDSDASGLARKRMPRRPGRESVTGRVALSGQVEQIPDNQADPEFAVPTDQRMKMRSLIGVPLLRDGVVEGVFVLGRPEPGPFSERAVELVKGFADQAVIAIQNVRLFEALQAKTHDLEETLDGLRKAQDRLIQSEKLASLGQLTAGIAHEIKNPLNFVNNFSGLSRELIDELREVLAKAPLEADQRVEADDLIGMLSGNLEKVVSHGKRADSIVKNMLLHSREGSGERASVNVNAMVEEALNLAYHGARAEKPGFNVTIEKGLDPAAGAADLYAQEMTRVILNLISNAFYATTKRKQSEADGAYEPTVKASTRDLGQSVEIVIRDNGTGIPRDVQAKMFNPFFTTKPAGEGTGLGLSLSHDIVVKQHGGTLDVASEPGVFTEFTIRVPRGAAK